MEIDPKQTDQFDPRALLSRLADEGHVVFTLQQAVGQWRGSQSGLKNLLRRMVRRGWVERLSQGRYLMIPVEAGLSRRYTLPEFVLASQIVTPGGVAFWSALNYHGLTEQIPDAVYVQTTRVHVPNVREVGGTRIRIVRLPTFRFFGHTTAWFGEQSAQVTDIEKTLVDGLFLPGHCGGMAEVVKGFAEARDRIAWDRLTDYARRMKRGSIFKRLGVLGERLGVDRKHLDSWRPHLTARSVYFDPAGPKRGQTVRGWRVILNMPLEEFAG